jgi:hypothetical protein
MSVDFHVTRRVLATATAALLALAAAGLAVTPPAHGRPARAVLAFLPAGAGEDSDSMLDALAAHEPLALGLVSATQGRYSPEQTVLDLSAGSRTAATLYDPDAPPPLRLVPGSGHSGVISGWSKAVSRAATAHAEIRPGMLAGRIGGGSGYAGLSGGSHLEAVAAANRAGRVTEVSLGRPTDLAARVGDLLTRRRYVVATLPAGGQGDAVLDQLLNERRAGEVLIVVQAPPRARTPQLLPAGAAGIKAGNGTLTSDTTRLDGIVAGIDVPATILRGLDLPIPDEVKGEPLRAEGKRDVAALKGIAARLRVVSGRRTATLETLMLAWLVLALALRLVAGASGLRSALRIGALAILWVVPMLLLTAWLEPGPVLEIAIITAGAFGLAAITDRFARWPRGPLVPAAAAALWYSIDLINGSPLIVRSLLGVNPRSGGRFYGIGNELEVTLTVLLLVGLGALLWNRPRSRGSAGVFAAAGLVLGGLIGVARLGADVGGVITVGAAVAAAGTLMLPGAPSPRRYAIVALAPVAALGALAAIDLLTGGNGHFTRTILQANSAESLWDVVVRRYTLALDALTQGVMPLLTIAAVLAVVYALLDRERLYAPVRHSPSWHAALAGGLTASIVGTLFNDSGPRMLVFGVFLLACATAYIWGDPKLVSARPARAVRA